MLISRVLVDAEAFRGRLPGALYPIATLATITAADVGFVGLAAIWMAGTIVLGAAMVLAFNRPER